ncbi:MAG: Rieske (2Fe-2S) protein, partial [Halobacteriaceae archaeon]
ALEQLMDTFDEEGTVNPAGQATADYIAAGGDIGRLRSTLGEALLREDAGFHTLQNIEAAFKQAELATDDSRRNIYYIACSRYLAAHTPTRREAEQTFKIAERLNRGEKIHEATNQKTN